MLENNWINEGYRQRQVKNRLAIHGSCHKTRENKKTFHKLTEGCTLCKFCGEQNAKISELLERELNRLQLVVTPQLLYQYSTRAHYHTIITLPIIIKLHKY